MNILISGPCGIGKSTVSRIFAEKTGMFYLNFDKLGINDLEKRQPRISPFSHKGLNLLKCMPIMLEGFSGEFILDIGCDNIFRSGTDNNRYLNDLFTIKKTYSINIVMLTAKKYIVFKRFTSTRNQIVIDDFEKLWSEWLTIGKPHWIKCSDFIIDTSSRNELDTCSCIEKYLN